MSNFTEIEVEDYKSELHRQVALAEALQRLESNKDFIKLIKDEYLTKFVARQIGLSVNPNLPTAGQNDSLRMAQGAGTFRNFVAEVYRQGAAAAASIQEVRENPELLQHPELEQVEG